MSIVQTSQIEIPNDPATLKVIEDAMKEISASMTRVEGEKDFQKEALADLAEKTGVPAKYLKKLSNLWHKQNRTEVEGDFETIGELYDAVFGSGDE